MTKIHHTAVCPICDESTLEYEGAAEIEEESLGYAWKCKNCGARGVEWYDLRFSYHTILGTIGEEQQA